MILWYPPCWWKKGWWLHKKSNICVKLHPSSLRRTDCTPQWRRTCSPWSWAFYFAIRVILRTGIILRFWSPTPTLPRWEREFIKSADYAHSQYMLWYATAWADGTSVEYEIVGNKSNEFCHSALKAVALISFFNLISGPHENGSFWHGKIALFVKIGSDSRSYREDATAAGQRAVCGIGVKCAGTGVIPAFRTVSTEDSTDSQDWPGSPVSR